VPALPGPASFGGFAGPYEARTRAGTQLGFEISLRRGLGSLWAATYCHRAAPARSDAFQDALRCAGKGLHRGEPPGSLNLGDRSATQGRSGSQGRVPILGGRAPVRDPTGFRPSQRHRRSSTLVAGVGRGIGQRRNFAGGEDLSGFERRRDRLGGPGGTPRGGSGTEVSAAVVINGSAEREVPVGAVRASPWCRTSDRSRPRGFVAAGNSGASRRPTLTYAIDPRIRFVRTASGDYRERS
jgi:hypothetical protein